MSEPTKRRMQIGYPAPWWGAFEHLVNTLGGWGAQGDSFDETVEKAEGYRAAIEREALSAWLASEEAVRELTGAIHRNEDDDHIADIDDGRADDCEDYARVILEGIREARRMAGGV